MHKLTRVLLNVNVVNSDVLTACDGYITACTDRVVKLCYLICFRQVGIKIILSVECTVIIYGTVKCKTCLCGKPYRTLI